METVIKVRISYNSRQLEPLISVIDQAVGGDNADVQRERLAVKSLFPLSILIQSASAYLFEKFVIDPLVGPYADKWSEYVRRHLEPMRPLRIVIHLEDASFSVEYSAVYNLEVNAYAWKWIKEALLLVRDKGLWDTTSKMRISTDNNGKLTVIGYFGGKPSYVLDLKHKKVFAVKSS